MNKNKRAAIGNFVSEFFSAIIIVALLIAFIFVAGVIRDFFGYERELEAMTEDSLGVTDGIGYMENYAKLVEARSEYDFSQNSFESVLEEVSYEK